MLVVHFHPLLLGVSPRAPLSLFASPLSPALGSLDAQRRTEHDHAYAAWVHSDTQRRQDFLAGKLPPNPADVEQVDGMDITAHY